MALFITCNNQHMSAEELFRNVVYADADGNAFVYTNTDVDGPALRTDAAGGGVTYYGYAPVGTSPAAALWKIKRVTVTGGLTVTEYADGNTNFDNEWDDRASLSYS